MYIHYNTHFGLAVTVDFDPISDIFLLFFKSRILFRGSSEAEQLAVAHVFFESDMINKMIMTKRKRTYADRAEYLKKAVVESRRKLKQKVVEYKGGKCVICGYSGYAGAFDLHHTNDKEKSFGLSAKGLTRSWDRIKKEADKCVLLCANCHREVHGGVTQLPKEI